MLDALHEWLVNWADSPAGPAMLGVLSAAEAIFFPIPPDPLLIALALRNPDDALMLATLTTAASVAGGVVGHLLGLRVGRPILQRFKASQVERVEALFVRHGFFAIVLAGLTPLPYKIFAIAAGAFGIARSVFIFASIVGRGLRFFMIAILIFFWGERFSEFLNERFELVVGGIGLVAIVAGGVWLLWLRRKGRIEAGAVPPGP
jgi:membrane protein YqaA with SNARE-associated domain